MSDKKKVIVQIFGIDCKSVEEMIPIMKAKGYTHIQIAPVQQHCVHNWRWSRVYQPCGGPYIGNSLGSKDDISKLISTAHKHGMGLIVDVVLHHTCGCPICSYRKSDALKWATYKGISYLSSKIGYVYLKNVFSNGVDRFNCTDWGPKEDINSDSIVSQHKELLTLLLDMGVDGFRFDAAKHIQPKYWDSLVKSLKTNRPMLNYCEVLDGSPKICSEYTSIGLDVVDFPLTFSMINAFNYGGSLLDLISPNSVSSDTTISIADCHDSKVGSSYHFGDDTDSVLAAGFILARGIGIPLIYYTFTDDKHIEAGMQFFHGCAGEPCFIHREVSTRNLLVIQRGSKGVAILNKASQWAHSDKLCLPGIAPGNYKELVYNFSISIRMGNDNNPWVEKWGTEGKGGFHIGPREILFILFQNNLP